MINLYNRDCMEAMKEMPDKCYDLAIVDPPFFKGVANGSFYGKGLSGSGRKRGVYSEIKEWNDNIPDQNYYDELTRVSKNQIIWGINYFHFQNIPHGRLIWDKKNDDSTFSKAEIASCTLIDSVQIFRYTWCGFLQEKGYEKETRIHPTQKPVALYRWILRKFTDKDSKILDTHLGSASIAIACDDAEISLDAFEINSAMYKAACNRLKVHQSQLKIQL